MSDKLKNMKETLMYAVEAQIHNLDEVDTKELGEVIDMIKDLEEATYYCAVTKAMEEAEEEKEKYKGKHGGEMMYYSPMPMYPDPRYMDWDREPNFRDMSRSYYSDGGNRGGSSGSYSTGSSGNSSGNSGSSSSGRGGSNGSSAQYTEREFPGAFQDPREGRSPRSRRMYMEAKETRQDKATQMRELEKYMQELATDVTEMIEGASPEERQYLSKKISALASKVTQTNG